MTIMSIRKDTSRKLRLSRETLRHLSPEELKRAAGARPVASSISVIWSCPEKPLAPR